MNRIRPDAAPDWPRGDTDDCYRVEIEGSPSINQETTFRRDDGRAPAGAGCLSTGLRALDGIPAVRDRPPGWVTPLDLPLVPGHGTVQEAWDIPAINTVRLHELREGMTDTVDRGMHEARSWLPSTERGVSLC